VASPLPQESALLHSILDHFPGGIAVYDKNLTLTLCNDRLKRMLDYPDELFAFGNPSMEQIFRFNAKRGEYGSGNVEHFVNSRLDLARKREPHVYERKRPNGQVLEVRGVPLEEGGFLTIYIDISLQQRQLDNAAASPKGEFDKLTGLPSVKGMEQAIDHLMRMFHHGDVACLHCIDINQFAQFNRQHGTMVGDFVLKEVASRLAGLARGTDFIARTGGDRFQVLQGRVLKPSDVTRFAGRMMEAIKKPIRCGEVDVLIGASIGFSIINSPSLTVDFIMQKANESATLVKNRQRSVGQSARDAA
jgi:diguanylate cyclase (GGDEF)-like protein